MDSGPTVQPAGFNRRDLLRSGVAASIAAVAVAASTIPAAAQTANALVVKENARGSIVDPSDVQVLFVDLQTSLVSRSKTAPPESIEKACGVFAEVAKILKLPTIFSVVPEGDAPPTLIPSLLPYSTKDNTLLRKPAGVLQDRATLAALQATRRKTLVIAGYAAEVAVLHAAMDAIKAGYTVYYVVDCIGSPSPRTEDATFRELDQAGAIPTSVLSLTTRLAPDFFNPPGSQTIAALRPLL